MDAWPPTRPWPRRSRQSPPPRKGGGGKGAPKLRHRRSLRVWRSVRVWVRPRLRHPRRGKVRGGPCQGPGGAQARRRRLGHPRRGQVRGGPCLGPGGAQARRRRSPPGEAAARSLRAGWGRPRPRHPRRGELRRRPCQSPAGAPAQARRGRRPPGEAAATRTPREETQSAQERSAAAYHKANPPGCTRGGCPATGALPSLLAAPPPGTPRPGAPAPGGRQPGT